MPKKQSKSTKKSPRKLDRVIKKLNLARPRNQFIVAFLVVGLIGGGWMAYQSFAASAKWFYTVDNGTLKSFANSAGCTIQNVKDSQKNNNYVINVACPKSNNYNSNTTTIFNSPAAVASSATGIPAWYRYCAYIKGTAPNLKITTTSYGKTTGIQFATHKINNSKYTPYCSPASYISTSESLQGSIEVQGYDGNAWFSVGSMVLERL